jgi:hypothetical protein
VYYPIEIYKEVQRKFWITYRENDSSIRGIPRESKKLPWRFYAWRNLTIQARPDGVFNNEFKSIIPIIFSHAEGASRDDYSVIGMEMASHGYMVFFIDHHDGSCRYTENGQGKCWKYYMD